MPPSKKSTERNAQRKAARKDAPTSGNDEPRECTSSGNMLGLVKSLVTGSCLVEVSPKLPELLKATEQESPKAGTGEEADPKKEAEAEGADAAEAEGDEGSTPAEGEQESPAPKDLTTPGGMFDALIARLPWHNALGLGVPGSGEASMEAWFALKGLQLDFGPKPRKKGSPGVERILQNVENHLPQYLHIFLALMMLRAFLFRSFFACLPWLFGYQLLSLMLPLEWQEKFPQVPPVHVKYRVAVTMGIHALVWLFFLFEGLYRTYWFEKILLVGLFAAHAYVFRPIEN